MRILVIAKASEAQSAILEVLKSRKLDSSATLSESIQEAIELLETSTTGIGLVICDYRGKGQVLPRSLLEVTLSIPCLLFQEKNSPTPETPHRREALLEVLPSGDFTALGEILDRLTQEGLFAKEETPDKDYLRISVADLSLQGALAVDIFVKLSPNHYCRRFKKNDRFDSEDLQQSFRNRGLDAFYILKTEIDCLVDRKNDETEALISAPRADQDDERMTVLENLALVHDVVQQLGFTPKVQELAKKTVNLLVKGLGGNPQLSIILKKLKKQEGKYIASHSVMLAEICCAMASRIGMNSATTFMKLGLASFLHDLTFVENRLALLCDFQECSEKNLTSKQLQEVKHHPVKAAELARKIHQIPPDVDTIVLQHHERPDGSGFPRGLFAHQMFPLSCLFVIAEDLLEYFLKSTPLDDSESVLVTFLEGARDYRAGAFRKIHEALLTGTPLQL
jgi:response regulator RpfG family c-di-GMP phosphodiesterase